MLCEQGNIARIEALSLVEVDLALFPLASPARDIGQRFRNLAAVRQKLTRLFKVMHRRVVILEAGVVVVSLRQYGLAEIGLKSERCFSGLSCLSAERFRWLKAERQITERINVRKQCPGQSKFWIQSHRFFEIFLCSKVIGR